MRAALVGAGLTKVEEHWDKGLTELMAEASVQALDSAGISAVDAVYVSNTFGQVLQEQSNIGAYLAEELGIRGVAASRVEAGGASGLAAAIAAVAAVSSGLYKSVLVVGGEKMSEATSEDYVSLLTTEEPAETVAALGVTQLAEAALLYKEYLKRNRLEHEDVAYFSVLSHEHSQTVPHAQYQFKITLDTVVNSPSVAEPIRRLETTAPADGAAAVVITSLETAQKTDGYKAVVSGIGAATDYLSPFDREDPLWLRSLSLASQRALEMAGRKVSDLDFVEVHDSYSLLTPLSLEAIGLAEAGESCHLARKGRWSLSGEVPVNTFGGLKGRGNPVGASGLYALVESFLQLSGRAGKNQVDGAKAGLVSSMAGLGSFSAVAVVEEWV
ncbi:MAG: thiolase family protein [Candidatus Caldarchaeum sp.]